MMEMYTEVEGGIKMRRTRESVAQAAEYPPSAACKLLSDQILCSG
jgi:hypothetical protein